MPANGRGARHLIDVKIRRHYAKDVAASEDPSRATVLVARDKAPKYGDRVWALGQARAILFHFGFPKA